MCRPQPAAAALWHARKRAFVPSLAPDDDHAIAQVPARDCRRSRDERSDAGGRTDAAADRDAREERNLVDKLRARPWLVAIIAIAAALALAAGIVWWLHARQFESTDDAFIDARTVTISSQVNGAIVAVPVTDNQLVDAGAV